MTRATEGTRVRRTYREIFLDKLKDLSEGPGALVPNLALRGELNWDEERYQQVKDQLVAEGLVTIGRGRGGMVGLVSPRGQGRTGRTWDSKKKPESSRRSRRPYRDIFLAKLTALSSGGKSLVPNGILRDELDWDEERYRHIKEQLVKEGLLIVGRGHGGTVRLAGLPEAKGLSVFVSYSHVDEELKTELMKHLEPLRRLHRIGPWHDRKIKAGDEWEKSIAGNIASADIILLLISIDFINSKYCYDVELQTAMERHEKGEVVVVPVILRNCLWHNMPFAKLQALPKDGKAVSSCGDRDDALAAIAEGILLIVESKLVNR